MAPSLHLDVIAEILRQDILDDVDLAQCCLVSRGVFPLAQRQLYHTIRLRFLGGFYDDEGTLLRGLDPATLDKAETVFENPHLADMIRRVEIDFEDFVGGGAIGWHEPATVYDGVFEECHNIEEVAAGRANWPAELAEVILKYRPRLRVIENIKFCAGVWDMLAEQPDLERLTYSRGLNDHREQNVRPPPGPQAGFTMRNDIREPVRDARAPPGTLLPFALRHLVLDSTHGGLSSSISAPIFHSSYHSLRSLVLIFDPALLSDFSRFTSLELLHLQVSHLNGIEGRPRMSGHDLLPDVVAALTTCRNLPLRTLALSHNFGHLSFVPVLTSPSLPPSLPASLTRLELSSSFTIADLEAFFARPCAARITQFGHGNWDDESGPEVDAWLAERGVEGLGARISLEAEGHGFDEENEGEGED
ncbi:hypothetical protein JCM10450v2_001543 [Rhodotorula kratochvilovae]